MRVAQVATADSSIRLLLAGQVAVLRSQGYEVDAVCAPGPFVSEVRQSGVVVHEVPMSRRVRPDLDLVSLAALTRLFRREQYDVVHTHTPKAGLLGPLAARLAGVPFVMHTVHGFLFHDEMPWSRRAAFRAVERFTAASVDQLLFQSAEDLDVARRWRLLPQDRLTYLGNGIDTRWFDPVKAEGARAAMRRSLGLRDDDVVVGTVGRLVYEKGYREFFEATRRLLARHADVQVVVVGGVEPDQSDAVRPEEIARLEATGRVRFLGLRRDVRELYAAMDLFVLASHREGIPRALMEACALRVPVIATDIRGCREVVDAGRTGVLVPVRDAAALFEAMSAAVTDLAAARRLGDAARQRILDRFDERQVNERLLAAYAAAGLAPEPRARPVEVPA